MTKQREPSLFDEDEVTQQAQDGAKETADGPVEGRSNAPALCRNHRSLLRDSAYAEVSVRAAQDGSDAGSTASQGSASLAGCERAADEGSTVHVPSHATGDSLERQAPDETPAWHEVPAALFLSWSDARQLEYCARRDECTMLDEHDDISDWWMEFYAERAVSYRTAVNERTNERGPSCQQSDSTP